MSTHIKRTLIVMIIVILISLLLTFYGVYLPMKHELESNLQRNFELLAESKVDAFTETINKSLQGAKSLSSRSAIRDKIVAYKAGEVNLDTLKSFTKDKYRDGVLVISDVTHAIRVVDGEIVAEYYGENYIDNSISITDESRQLDYFIKLKGDMVCLEVNSPIYFEDEILGRDLLGFCLNDTIEGLNDDDVNVEISNLETIGGKLDNYENLFEDEQNIYYVLQIDTIHEIVVLRSKKVLYESISHLTQKSTIYLAGGYTGILLVVYIYMVQYAKNQVKHLAIDRDTYKKQADKDALTGASSRAYFDEFIRSHSFETGVLIIIDLDDFKKINDTYGHLTGDEVLKGIVNTIKSVIRSDDLLVRYGGDEFILLLRKDDIKGGTEVINRIRDKLAVDRRFGFDVDFSYGMVAVEAMSEIETCLSEADHNMYLCKSEKKGYTIKTSAINLKIKT